ncbi:MAG: xanthine dehydrogenase YagR molybdenum-binding subunit [Solirubrobacteraceae bacterium]|jgi:xanthine dehydrogenase YagR molybdenum-binding subunit|nr:xanthine dehydrogenase YagR molybdenum-binding subunit [Solirubrobacteraceae bacterium]
MSITERAPLQRIEGEAKVRGEVRYAYERSPEGIAYAVGVSSTIARGTITSIGQGAGGDGVLLVLTHQNAARLQKVDDGELHVLQTPDVVYRGQLIALVVAETLEAARAGADQLEVEYEPQQHDVVLRDDHPDLFAPDGVNGGYETDSVIGDAERDLADAPISVDHRYSTPPTHNNAMEPHASVAHWEGDTLVVHDSSQGVMSERDTLAKVFGLEPEQVHVISEHVGGGFGSKGTPRPQAVLAALAAKALKRPVKLAITRQQMFAVTGYRTPTQQRVALGADIDGRITSVIHAAYSQSSRLKEFTEQTATATRVMYGGAHRSTTHRLVRLDVPTPSWLRAPGEAPGMFALESAIDELAHAAGLDPIELRLRNEPEVHPESGKAWSSRSLVACLQKGAAEFGWPDRDRLPRQRIDGRYLYGTGVAAAMYPVYRAPGYASATDEGDGTFTVRIAAADIGQGARTVLTQIAAEALEVDPGAVTVLIGDSVLPRGGTAGGSMGTASWGSAVHGACRQLREDGGTTAEYDTREELKQLAEFARHGFGAEFAAVRVDGDTGEVRVERMLGVFGVGRVINARLARSQLIGGMTMGLGMALMEESIVDREFGDFLNHDLAQAHVPANADVIDIDATWVDEVDENLNPMGSKGIGEIGITGASAAIANAVWHATGVRVRDLPIHLEDLI